MVEETQTVKHFFVPEHIKLTDEQKYELLKKYNISIKQLPMIHVNDPALKDMDAKIHDVILVRRASQTAKETEYYRVVVDG